MSEVPRNQLSRGDHLRLNSDVAITDIGRAAVMALFLVEPHFQRPEQAIVPVSHEVSSDLHAHTRETIANVALLNTPYESSRELFDSDHLQTGYAA